MEIVLVIAILILVLLSFLATIDMAFSQLSDVSLRRLSGEAEENSQARSFIFLREILENRPRFRFALSTAIQILLITFTVSNKRTVSDCFFDCQSGCVGYFQAVYSASAHLEES
jgi:CBS domain containing-hemolysin-like protein